MASDFTVIMRVRHQFGDGKKDPDETNFDSAAPFVGFSGEFPFSCSNVDPFADAILQFSHRGSNQHGTFPTPQPDGGHIGISQEHPVKINGILLSGGVPAAAVIDHMPYWSTRLLLIPPGILREQNILRIETSLDYTNQIDDFTVDNVVVFFKTRAATGPVVKGGVIDLGQKNSQ